MKFVVIPPADSYMAISGGVDSIAAAFVARKKFGIERAYHFNHGLRSQNDEMEEKVKDFCKKFHFDLVVKRGSNLKTEAECREARIHGFFEAVGGNLITAHHLDDCVESYLLNCFRGHSEFLPIPLVSDFRAGKIFHPFLAVQKKDFLKIARQNNLMRYLVEDETNNIVKGSRRNFIRKEIVPLLEAYELGIKKIVHKRYIHPSLSYPES